MQHTLVRLQPADDPVWGPFRPFRGGVDRGLPTSAPIGTDLRAGTVILIPGQVEEEPWKGNQRVDAAPEVDDYHAKVLAPLGEAARLRQTPKRPLRATVDEHDYADKTAREQHSSPAIQSTTRNIVTVKDAACLTEKFQFAALRAPSERMNLADFSSRFSFKRDYRYMLINYNKELTDMLTELLAMYECKLHGNDDFRAKNLKLVIETIKRVPFRVRDWGEFKGWLDSLHESARKRTGLGDKWVEKIKGYCTYGVLADLENRRSARASQSARDLVRLFGVGPSKAKEMVRQGIGGIQDLRQRVQQGRIPTWGDKGITPLLEKDSLKCLPLLEDLEQRIPRAEVEELLAQVTVAAEAVYGKGKVRLTVCGSYRRGKASCGDMDIIITTPTPCTRGVIPGPSNRSDAPLPAALPLRPLLDKLTGMGLVSHHLRNADTDGGGEMFMKSVNVSSRVQQEKLKRVMDGLGHAGGGQGHRQGLKESGQAEVWDRYREESVRETLEKVRTPGQVGYDSTPSYARRDMEGAGAGAGGGGGGGGGSQVHAPNARHFLVSGLRGGRGRGRGAAAASGHWAGNKRRKHDISPGEDDSEEEAEKRAYMRLPPPTPSPPRPAQQDGQHQGKAQGQTEEGALYASQQGEEDPPLEVHSPSASQRAVTEQLADAGVGVSHTPTRAGKVLGQEEGKGHTAVPLQQQPVDPANLPYLPWPPACYDHEMWMGIMRLPGPGRLHRRVDIKSYPTEVYPFALLYFTGSGFFNRSLRLYVQKCGWSLSDRGLCPAYRCKGAPGKGWDKVWEGHSLACETEEDLFAACGLPYIAPEAREASVEEVGIEEALEARRLARMQAIAAASSSGTSTTTEAVAAGASTSMAAGKGKARYVCPGGLDALLKIAQRERGSGLGAAILEEVRVEREKRAAVQGRREGHGGAGAGQGLGMDASPLIAGDDDDAASLLGAESQAGDLPLEVLALVQGPLDMMPAEEGVGGGGGGASQAAASQLGVQGGGVERLSARELLEEEEGSGDMADIAYGLASRLHAVGSGR